MDAIQSIAPEDVIFLPNNRNIVPAAQRAVELAKKRIKVVPSVNIPQGIAAMLAFNPENTRDESVGAMERALTSVRSAEICLAVRPVQLNSVAVREGQTIGLLERELVVAGDDSTQVLIDLLKTADVSEGDLVTLYWGGPLAQEQAAEDGRLLEDISLERRSRSSWEDSHTTTT